MSTDVTHWVDPDARVERIQLDPDCWVDIARALVPQAERVHAEVAGATRWQTGQTYRYERWVQDQRRSTTVNGTRRHPALVDVEHWLIRRYRVRFTGIVLSEYRHAAEGLGFHRDRGMTWLDDTLVALLTLGARRPFLLRPDSGRPLTDPDDALRDAIDLSPSGGDLLVMGGRCQRTWLHAVPTVDRPVGNRISAQWRWTSRRGEPDTDPLTRDPRVYAGASTPGAPGPSGRRNGASPARTNASRAR
jgi:alkylated DNA repair dioxygenase AlkB